MIENTFAEKIATAVVDRTEGRAYYVGGCVRDDLLGLHPKDIDIEVFGVSSVDLESILRSMGSVTLCGESFGILKVTDSESGQTVDVGIPRKDYCVGRGHTTFDVDTNPNMTTEQASNRRDITINAVYRNIVSKELFDFHGGLSDLHAGIIRAVDESRFMEDPLRMLRAIKFASRFGFVIEHDTLRLIKNNAYKGRDLPNARIFGEISDILMEGKKPSYGFHLMDTTGLLDLYSPEISVLRFVEQNPEYHPEGDVLTHTMLCLDYMPIAERELIIQLALLYHDTGKLFGTIDHEKKSAEIVKDGFPVWLTENNEIIYRVSNLVRHHMRLYGGNITRGRVKRLAAESSIPDLIKIYRADKFSRGLDPMKQIAEEGYLKSFLDTSTIHCP